MSINKEAIQQALGKGAPFWDEHKHDSVATRSRAFWTLLGSLLDNNRLQTTRANQATLDINKTKSTIKPKPKTPEDIFAQM